MSNEVPQSVESEMAIISAMLVEPTSIAKISITLKPEDFWRTSHVHIYAAILELAANGETATFVSITDVLQVNNTINDCGGTDNLNAYLKSITDGVPSSYGFERWAGIIAGHSKRRMMLAELGDLRTKALDTSVTNDELAQELSALSTNVNAQQAVGSSKTASQIVDESIATYETGGVEGMTTGYESLDIYSGGMIKGGLYIVGARPSQGKSALLMNILERHQKAGRSVGAVVLEMTAKQNMDRLVAMRAGVDSLKVRRGQLDETEILQARDAWKSLRTGFVMNDREGQTVSQIAAQARVWVAEHKIEILIIDYLQIIKAEDESIDRRLQIGQMTRGLKNLARELDIVVIAACQLSRESERSKGRPMLSHLKEAGNIEEDADGVLGIYKDMSKDVNSNQFSKRWEVEIGWMKNRHGGMGHMDTYYHTKTNTFTEIKPKF